MSYSNPIPGNFLTTAMAVMPHTDVQRALELAASLDIPFWPQLPHLNYYEDMYVQAAEHFPGIILDVPGRTLRFSHQPPGPPALSGSGRRTRLGDCAHWF